MEALFEIFKEMQDGIYFPGYVSEMETENPERLEFEWKEFLKMFK
ncbi:MAG TPA: hypothetical protein PKN44_13070 [Bacteroidales bacterium]|nr:hypothetical protein [Bacteroidales bacterium]